MHTVLERIVTGVTRGHSLTVAGPEVHLEQAAIDMGCRRSKAASVLEWP